MTKERKRDRKNLYKRIDKIVADSLSGVQIMELKK